MLLAGVNLFQPNNTKYEKDVVCRSYQVGWNKEQQQAAWDGHPPPPSHTRQLSLLLERCLIHLADLLAAKKMWIHLLPTHSSKHVFPRTLRETMHGGKLGAIETFKYNEEPDNPTCQLLPVSHKRKMKTEWEMQEKDMRWWKVRMKDIRVRELLVCLYVCVWNPLAVMRKRITKFQIQKGQWQSLWDHCQRRRPLSLVMHWEMSQCVLAKKTWQTVLIRLFQVINQVGISIWTCLRHSASFSFIKFHYPGAPPVPSTSEGSGIGSLSARGSCALLSRWVWPPTFHYLDPGWQVLLSHALCHCYSLRWLFCQGFFLVDIDPFWQGFRNPSTANVLLSRTQILKFDPKIAGWKSIGFANLKSTRS